MSATANDTVPAQRHPIGEVFRIFLRLGLTSFGGPIAHLGYFRNEFVVRRRWLDESTFADLVALCQFLPGPASSQIGFALGLSRSGLPGGLAAWLGFTMPSAVALFAFAELAGSLSGRIADAALYGLKIVAVAVVAQAVWGMARTLAFDMQRIAIAIVGGLLVVFFAGSLAQISAMLFGAVSGIILCRQTVAEAGGHLSFSISRRLGIVVLVIFTAILLGAPVAAASLHSHALILFDAFYRSGALLFGALPFWDEFRKRVGAQAVMRGVNAAVVGILAAALYNPVWTGAIHNVWDFVLALAGFLLLTVWKCPPWIVVAGTAAGAVAMATFV